jgi:alkylation response protein AidB-like acyl-CoA dehydrogenase
MPHAVSDPVVRHLPQTQNRFQDDPSLGRLLSQHLSPEALEWAHPVLDRMGRASAEELDEWATLADKNPPRLETRDRFGQRVDKLNFHPAYRNLQQFAYGEGIVNHYYDPEVRQRLGTGLEVVKFAQGYLFAQAEQGLYCPICMTDGSAYLIEKYATAEQKERFLPHLTSPTLGNLWEGGMFLTEKAGGSDVGATQTAAWPTDGGRHRLYGEKWFCSNASAELVMVLARTERGPAGTAGLGLFALRRHKEDGKLNHLHLERLKDKLGTRSMPTGEVLLNGSVAESIGSLSQGFAQMTDMLNLSRLYNATASVAIMRRVISECLRYGATRQTFGRSLLSYPMVRQTLVDLTVDLEASLHLLFYLYRCRGKWNLQSAQEEEVQHLRMFVPLAKLSTGRLAVKTASEGVELHGGNGYIEDWPMARLLRDAQVLPIWEGTTNILALDTLRSIRKDGCDTAMFAFMERHAQDPRLTRATQDLRAGLGDLLQDPTHPAILPWCWQAVRIFQAGLLLQAARDERGQLLAEQYLARYFGADRDHLRPHSLDHAQRHFEALIGQAPL